MLIQIILIAAIILIILRLIYKLKIKEISPKQFFSWLFLWLLAILVIWQPKLTVILANQVGIGRGVDLVIYVSIIVVFYLRFRLLLRIEQLEKNITKIVKDDALKNIFSDDKK